MCGRFTLTRTARAVADLFALPEPPAVLKPRYNVAPRQLIAVVGLKKDGRTRGLIHVSWGFVAHWSNAPNDGPRPINAKCETVATKHPFKDSFVGGKRCLVPADGFFEWEAVGKQKVAHHFRLRSGDPFAFAGVWDSWRGESGPPLLTCAIVTTPANDLVQPFHDRMPLILPPESWDVWLNPDSRVVDLMPLLVPFPADGMGEVRVGPAVNKVQNDGPECLAPAA